jgi:hypothetical protein
MNYTTRDPHPVNRDPMPRNNTRPPPRTVLAKTVVLENDQIFRHAVNLNNNLVRESVVSAEQRAENVREKICEFVLQGKIDALDLKIIFARDCSPMPTLAEVSKKLGITRQAIRKRIDRLQLMFAGV